MPVKRCCVILLGMMSSIQENGNEYRWRRWARMTSAVALVLAVVLAAVILVPAVSARNSMSAQELQLMQQFETVYQFIRDSYVDEVDPATLFEGALQGMFESLDDPHSAYLNAEDVRSLTDTTSGEFGGVGLYIGKQPENGDQPSFVEVVSPIEGTPAYHAGIIGGDLIVAIEGESTAPLSIDEVVDKLRGRPGTDVQVTVQRGNAPEFFVDITRAIIEVPTVRHAMIGSDIGYLRIVQFTPHTAGKVEEAVRFFDSQGYSSMIIDLRGNPGGLLNAVVDVCSVFFDDGLVVGTRGRIASENQRFYAQGRSLVPEDMDILVLIDKGSASAAEIMAGALKDRGRAVLAGETSYGKGSVQQVRLLGEGGFRLTMARYYLPDGEFIDKIGVDPHIQLDQPELSEEEQERAIDLLSEGRVRDWVRVHSEAEIGARQGFSRALQQEFDLPQWYIDRLLAIEFGRQSDEQPVYDLTYDSVLQQAVELVRNGQLDTWVSADSGRSE